MHTRVILKGFRFRASIGGVYLAGTEDFGIPFGPHTIAHAVTSPAFVERFDAFEKRFDQVAVDFRDAS